MKANAIGAIFANQSSFIQRRSTAEATTDTVNFRSITVRTVKGTHDFINLEIANDKVLREVFSWALSKRSDPIKFNNIIQHMSSNFKDLWQGNK